MAVAAQEVVDGRAGVAVEQEAAYAVVGASPAAHNQSSLCRMRRGTRLILAPHLGKLNSGFD